LKGKGLLEVKHGEGTYVNAPDSSLLFHQILFSDDISKLFSVRKILEAGAAELAAIHRLPNNLKKMKATLTQVEKATTMQGWEADFDFHLCIAEATQNDIILDLMKTIATTTKQAIMDVYRIVIADPSLGQQIYEQHVAIYRAIYGRDQAKARQSMIEHLVYVEELLYRY
jgi:GntR family transcriptional repressor for pyruvate dehydrogenase complex